jgi:hypothetical protein
MKADNDSDRGSSVEIDTIRFDITRTMWAIGTILFAFLLAFLAFIQLGNWLGDEVWKEYFMKHFPLLVGVPCAVVTAFAIVLWFYTGFRGNIEFKVFGLSFSGPGAPVMLWIASFLAVVAAIAILR